MNSKKLTQCKSCGAEIAKSAKTCPQCGAKNKKPIYKRWWLWALVIVFVIGLVPGGEGDQVEASAPPASEQTAKTPAKPVEPAPEPVIEYAAYTADEMMADLKANAMKAEQKYDDQYVEITGRLSVIDSDGRYISLFPDDPFAIVGVQCFIKTDEQRKKVMDMSVGDTVTLQGKITDVGEIMAYTLNIDTILE